MAKIQKLIEQLLSIPADFTWDDLIKVLIHFGFNEKKRGKTGGSRRKFADSTNDIISLHKPHPGNIVKKYQIKEVINKLKERGKL